MSALERESATQLYVRPPVLAAGSATHLVRKVGFGVRRNVIGIGFLAACTAVGILAGTAIAFHSSRSPTHPVTPAASVLLTVQPIANPPPSPPARPIVKPIADPRPAKQP